MLRCLMLLTAALITFGSSRDARAQTILSPRCDVPAASSLSVPVQSFSFAAPTSAPVVLNVQRPIVANFRLQARNRSHRRYAVRSAAPVLLQSVPVVNSFASNWAPAASPLVTAPAAVNSVPAVSAFDASQTTSQVRLRLRVQSSASNRANSIQSNSADCRCDPETLRSLSQQLDALSRQLDELERTRGVSATATAPCNDPDKLLDGINGDE